MIRMKVLLAALVCTLAVAAVPSAHAAGCAATGGTVAAPCVHYVAAGSSAMFQQFAVAVVNDVAPNTAAAKAGGTIHHYTIKGSTGCGGNCVNLHDVRPGGPPDTAGTFWIVYVCAAACNNANVTDVWEYDQVDSTVGVRSILATPSNENVLAAALDTAPNLQLDLIHSSLFLSGDTDAAPQNGCVAGHLTTCDSTEIPTDVFNLAQDAAVNTGMTDITPDDAYFATQRLLAPIAGCGGPSQWGCLGFGPGPVGANIVSSFSTSFATPTAFALPGGVDPITAQPVPASMTTLSVGEEPIVFLANRTSNTGLGYLPGGAGTFVPMYTNLVDNYNVWPYAASPVGQLFGGTLCSGSSPAFGLSGAVPPGGDFPVNPVLREALSGTMNTTEFSVFRSFGGNLANVFDSEVSNALTAVTTSQEANVGGVNLGKTPGGTACTTGLGTRFRAIGTGEEVGKPGGTGVGFAANNLGYTFFSFGNVSPYANLATYGYLTVDGVDPIFHNYVGGAGDTGQPDNLGTQVQGVLPGCAVENNGGAGGCLRGDVWKGGDYFPHLVDGTYRAWSLLRAVCDKSGPICLSTADPFGTEAIIEAAQDDIHGEACGICHPMNASADFLPFSLDKSFGPTGTIFGDAGVVRSHYAFNSAIGVTADEYPNTHTITPAGYSLAPVSGLNADMANGVGPGVENGGDAGGCIIAIDDSGIEGGITSFVYPAVNTQHVKFNYTPATAVIGVCGPGVTAPAVVGGACDQSNTPASGAPGPLQCGVNSTCNPPPQGMSLAVTGEANNQFNGVFQVTKIVIPGALKVKTPMTLTGVTTNTSGSQLTVSTGCAQ